MQKQLEKSLEVSKVPKPKPIKKTVIYYEYLI
jgi:hypothetical protein